LKENERKKDSSRGVLTPDEKRMLQGEKRGENGPIRAPGGKAEESGMLLGKPKEESLEKKDDDWHESFIQTR